MGFESCLGLALPEKHTVDYVQHLNHVIFHHISIFSLFAFHYAEHVMQVFHELITFIHGMLNTAILI